MLLQFNIENSVILLKKGIISDKLAIIAVTACNFNDFDEFI